MNSEISFLELGLSPAVIEIITKKGFKSASEIQAKAIPVILEDKHDLVGIAQTGTGKTAAFGLPMMDMISLQDTHVKAIILTPTRELAIQVSKELDSFKTAKNIKILPVYGGQPIFQQIKDLRRGIDIVVGTPGRVLDLINRRVLSIAQVEFLVLDEADEMLKMGFIEDIETILEQTPKEKRTLLFSATMPPRIKALFPKYMRDQVTVEVKRTEVSKKNIEQIYHIVRLHDKFETIKNIIDMADDFHGIIFCQTKATVDELTALFHKEKLDVNCIHGDIAQASREKILQSFRDRKINILVATDVAARGIDIEDLTHVINHSLPREIDSYTHRIGRTGRAGKKGIAITLIDPREEYKIQQLQKITENTITLQPLPTKTSIAIKRQEKMFQNLEEILNTKDTSYYQKASQELIQNFGDTNIVAALLYQINGGIPPKEDSRPTHSGRERDSRDNRDSQRNPSRDSRSNNQNFRPRSDKRPRPEEPRRRPRTEDRQLPWGKTDGSEGFGKDKRSSRPGDTQRPWEKTNNSERPQERRTPSRSGDWGKQNEGGDRSRSDHRKQTEKREDQGSWEKPRSDRSARPRESKKPWDKPAIGNTYKKSSSKPAPRKPKNRGKKRREE